MRYIILILLVCVVILLLRPLCFSKSMKESYRSDPVHGSYVIRDDNFVPASLEEKVRFNILVPFYNIPSKLLTKCINSIHQQNYKNYRVCLVDDASTRHRQELHEVMDYACQNHKNFICIKKSENKGTLHSNVDAMKLLKPDKNDVCIILDGDDELYGPDVLTYLADVYNEADVNITFGNYLKQYRNGRIKKTNHIKFNSPWFDIAENKLWRTISYQASHLKTFRYRLFEHVNHEIYLKRDGEYIRAATDVATMLPLLEMAGHTFKVIERPLYLYNCDLPTNHHGGGRGVRTQQKMAKYIKSLRPLRSMF
jgi:glycosyltransferase involved in cell wall biosynthesis